MFRIYIAYRKYHTAHSWQNDCNSMKILLLLAKWDSCCMVIAITAVFIKLCTPDQVLHHNDHRLGSYRLCDKYFFCWICRIATWIWVCVHAYNCDLSRLHNLQLKLRSLIHVQCPLGYFSFTEISIALMLQNGCSRGNESGLPIFGICLWKYLNSTTGFHAWKQLATLQAYGKLLPRIPAMVGIQQKCEKR